MSKTGTYGIDWKNVNLKDGYERSQTILSGYTFDELLLEIEHNCRTIDAKTVREQFEKELRNKVREAREIFADNLQNIVNEAKEYREQD